MMTIVRREATDVLLFEEEGALLLYDSRLVQLTLLGHAIYEETAEVRTVDELVEEMQSRFGTPPDSDARVLTLAAVRHLADAAVLDVTGDA